MRKANKIVLYLFVLTLVACATSQTLTPDQQARASIDRATVQLNTWFDTAKSYYSATPTKKMEWHLTIVPAFDAANKALKATALQLRNGELTPDKVQPIVQDLTNNIMQILISKGVLK